MLPIKPLPPDKLETEPPKIRPRQTFFPIHKFYKGKTMFKKIGSFLLERLKEGSTWVAGSILATLGLSGEASSATVDLVISVLSFLLVVLPDRQKPADNGNVSG